MAKRYESFNNFSTTELQMHWLAGLLNEQQPSAYQVIKNTPNYMEVMLEWEQDKE